MGGYSIRPDQRLNNLSGVRGGGWSDVLNSLLKAIREGVQKDGKVQIIGVRVASKPEPVADFDGSGIIDGNDFLVWQRDPSVGLLSDWEDLYGTAVSLKATSAVVPEPTTMALALAALCLVIGRRRDF
jgi:hypothetical protein